MSGDSYRGRVPLALICGLALLLLTGCTIESKAPEAKPGWHAIAVPAPDGRPVLCIVNDGDGISCNWAHR